MQQKTTNKQSHAISTELANGKDGPVLEQINAGCRAHATHMQGNQPAGEEPPASASSPTTTFTR